MKNRKLVNLLQFSMLVALQVVFSRFLAFSTPIVKISAGFVPVMLAGALYGVPGGFTVAAISDLIGALLFPQGTFFIGYTLTASLTGCIFGLFFHYDGKDMPYTLRVFFGFLLNALIVTAGLNTLCIAFQYGYLLTDEHDFSRIGVKFMAFLPKRLIEAGIMLPIQTALGWVLLVKARLCRRLRSGHVPEKRCQNHTDLKWLLAALPAAAALCLRLDTLPVLPEGTAFVRYLGEFAFTDGVLCASAFLLCCVLFRFTRKLECGVRERICGALLALIFVSSGLFSAHNYRFYTDPARLILVCVSLAGSYLLFCSLAQAVFYLFDRIRIEQENGGSRLPVYAGVIFLCTLPYLLITGGTLTADAYDQLGQITGAYSRSAVFSTGRLALNDTQPVAHTLLLGVWYLIGGQTGITVCAWLQVLAFALAAGHSVDLVRRAGGGKAVTSGLTLLYALMPLYPIYACAALKDTAFAIALMEAMNFTCELLMFPHRLTPVKKAFGTAAWLLTGLFRSFGLYLTAFLFIGTALSVPKKSHRDLLLPAAAIVLCAVILFAVYPTLGIGSGPESENRSLMAQQTALCMKEHSDDMTEKERSAILTVFGDADISELYDPVLSNPVKNQALGYRGSWKSFDRAWLSMGLRHPGTYLRAALCMGSDYWDLRRDAADSGLLVYLGDYGRFEDGIRGENPRAEAFGVEYRVSDSRLRLIRYIKSGVLALSRLPGVSLLFRPGLYLYALIFAVFHMSRRRCRGAVLPLTLILLGFGLVLSPLSGSTRYAFPILLCAPAAVVWCICFSKKNNPDEPE